MPFEDLWAMVCHVHLVLAVCEFRPSRPTKPCEFAPENDMEHPAADGLVKRVAWGATSVVAQMIGHGELAHG